MELESSEIARCLAPFVAVREVMPLQKKKLLSRLLKPKKPVSFGGYSLGSIAGEGATGTVYRVIDKDELAIKLIPRARIDCERLEQITRELRCLSEVHHAHIIHFSKVVISPLYVGLVMDCARTDLYNYLLANGRLCEPDAQQKLSQLVSAVDSLHSSSILHRDIKLENVVGVENKLVLCDFEMCHDFKKLGFPFVTGSCGSPTYCPPEAVLNPGSVYDGCKADSWALGVLFYACLAGFLPFDDLAYPCSNQLEIRRFYEHVWATPLAFPEWLSSDVCDLLGHMLDKQFSTRASIVDVKRHRWFVSAGTSIEPLSRLSSANRSRRGILQAPLTWDPFVGFAA